MADYKVDVRGETCPIPLVEMRKALKKASSGDTIEIIGTHPASKHEIPMAADALKIEIVSNEPFENGWKIILRK